MDEQDWSKVERTQDLIDYVYAKYGNTWKESDEATDEMLDDLYNFAMMKKSKKRKAKLMVSDEMGKGKVEDLQNRVSKLEVDLAWALKAKQAEHDKGKAKQAEHDLYDVDLDGLDLENIVKKLKEVFSRMLKAKEAKEAGEAELKVNEDQELTLLSLPQDPELPLLPLPLSKLPQDLDFTLLPLPMHKLLSLQLQECTGE
nr:peptidase C48, SUMO/sentrin/Ubl1 [Tanacetum cinerariifolium]